MHSFTESDLSDTDNIVPFKNTTAITQNKKVKTKKQNRLTRLTGVVFSNGTMLSASDKSDSVNKRTQEISKLMKLHNQGVWQNAHKFTRQLAHSWRVLIDSPHHTHISGLAM